MPKAKPSYIYNQKYMVGIYKITSPSGKMYIGKSIDIEKRHIQYKNGHCKQQTHLYNSLMKYGWDKHQVEILEECTPDILDEKEKYWIKYYDSVNEGLNLTYGGEGGIKSEITKKRISHSLNNRSKKEKNKHYSAISRKLKGRKITQEHKEILTHSRKSTINILYQYNLDGNFIQEWQNPKQASLQLEISSGYLHSIIDTDKTIHGFRFTTKKYKNLKPTTKWDSLKKVVMQYSKNGNLMQEFDSAKKASQILDIKIQNITACCRGEIKSAKGFIFKYKS